MIRASLTGSKELKAALKRIGSNADKEIEAAVRITAQAVRVHAQRSIARGTKSGTVYDKTQPRRSHRASAPGEAPATDTQRLIGSIRANVTGTSASVIVNTVYAAALEFGTSTIEARPFLIPALERERPAWDRRLNQVVEKASKSR